MRTAAQERTARLHGNRSEIAAASTVDPRSSNLPAPPRHRGAEAGTPARVRKEEPDGTAVQRARVGGEHERFRGRKGLDGGDLHGQDQHECDDAESADRGIAHDAERVLASRAAAEPVGEIGEPVEMESAGHPGGESDDEHRDHQRRQVRLSAAEERRAAEDRSRLPTRGKKSAARPTVAPSKLRRMGTRVRKAKAARSRVIPSLCRKRRHPVNVAISLCAATAAPRIGHRESGPRSFAQTETEIEERLDAEKVEERAMAGLGRRDAKRKRSPSLPGRAWRRRRTPP